MKSDSLPKDNVRHDDDEMSLRKQQEQTLLEVNECREVPRRFSWRKNDFYSKKVVSFCAIILLVLFVSGIFVTLLVNYNLSLTNIDESKIEQSITTNEFDNNSDDRKTFIRMKSYSEENVDSSERLGHLNLYFHKRNKHSQRQSLDSIAYPVARFPHRYLRFNDDLLSIIPWSTIYIDQVNHQTIIYSRDNFVYILPPLLNTHNQLFSIAELILSNYVSLHPDARRLIGTIDFRPYFKLIPLHGSNIPKFNYFTRNFMGAFRTEYGPFYVDKQYSRNNHQSSYKVNNYYKKQHRSPIDSNKKKVYCEVIILGAGQAGSHSAYRLSPIYKNNLCIFESEKYVGGRAYDIDYNGNVPEAYSTVPIAPMGGVRVYEGQPVVKQLADELNITMYKYDYQTFLIKARGRLFTQFNDMCSTSYVNVTCADDEQGNNPQDHLWQQLLDEFHRDPSNTFKFADLNAFCRYLFGDENTEFLRDSFRFRGDFIKTNTYSYMEFLEQDFRVYGTIYYPHYGLSQIAKRMIFKATKLNQARLYLNEQVLRIDDIQDKKDNYIFSIETTNYKAYGKSLVIGIPPFYWTNIHGSIANDIKDDLHFKAILPIQTVVIDSYWPRRWWEETSLSSNKIDRAWTRQNCISFIEILSAHPEKQNINLTRTVFDDGQCTDTWAALISRSSETDLVDEILRGLKAVFIDVDIPKPTKTFTKVWPDAWHFLNANNTFTNKQIQRWALKPLERFQKQQLSLIGEAFYTDRSGWTDGAIKSSLFSLYSQFNINTPCYQDDLAADGEYCTDKFI